MRNIYAMIVITIVLFVVSMDYVFITNIFIDLLIVIVYLILIARGALSCKYSGYCIIIWVYNSISN